MINLLILGAGALAEDVLDFIESDASCAMSGFIEGVDRSGSGCGLHGYPVHWIDDIGDMAADHLILPAIGSVERRVPIETLLEQGFRLHTLAHARAYVAGSAALGRGVVVAPGAVVAARSRIHDGVYVNRAATIGHHTTIGAYSTLCPGVNIGGKCAIGEGVFLGIGATVIDRITIADGAFIAAGALVTEDVGAGARVAPAPSRPRVP
jgi:acetyltransferase EpsM